MLSAALGDAGAETSRDGGSTPPTSTREPAYPAGSHRFQAGEASEESDGDDYVADLLAGLDEPIRFDDLFEGIRSVDDGLELSRLDSVF